MTNIVTIKYCSKCRWLMRSSWMSQELLSTFEEEIDQLALLPSTGGVFEIKVNEILVWSRKEMGGFPEIPQLKQLVRDIIAPEKDLGCIDRKTSS